MRKEQEARLNYLRSRDQEKYLKGASLSWKRFTEDDIVWDNPGCIFCSTTFTDEECPGTQQPFFPAGYVTEHEFPRWICELCFEDFKDLFNWKVVKGKEQINRTQSNKSFDRTLDRVAFIIKRLFGR